MKHNFFYSERVLLNLSTSLRALQINQKEASLSRYDTYFFGLRTVEWAPIILEMFSRKMDKLNIHNSLNSEYLSRGSADMLREVSIFLKQ